jgi:hypothetical protein
MNCQRLENVVSELARGQMMAAEQRREALAHIDVCEDCAARLRDEEMLTRGLKSLAADMESLAAPTGIETRLLEAFRTREVVVPVSVKQSNSRYWLAAVAAVLLIAMSLVALRWQSNGVDTPLKSVAGVTPAEKGTPVEKETNVKPPEEPSKAVEYQANDQSPKRNERRPNRQRRPRRSENTEVANHVTSEIATDFIPLRYMNAASLQDGGQIVRVELPRSALANFGLPVNMDRYNEKVKADVLFGVDGLAHAIRFVQ